MEEKYKTKPEYIFYTNEVESKNFILDEIIIIFLITSGTLWLIFFWLGNVALFTFIAIQCVIISLFRFIHIGEKRRKNRSLEMLDLITKEEDIDTLLTPKSDEEQENQELYVEPLAIFGKIAGIYSKRKSSETKISLVDEINASNLNYKTKKIVVRLLKSHRFQK